MSEPTLRTHSRVQFYGHFVWTTRHREPLIVPADEEMLYRAIVAAAERLNCQVLAVNGIADHIHLILRLPGSVSPAQAMKQIKGSSSAEMNDRHPEKHGSFRWAEGYGFFSMGQSPAEHEAIIAYVENQKPHHAANNLRREWEETVVVKATATVDTPDLRGQNATD